MSAPESITLKHGKASNTSMSMSLFGATITSWVVEGEENIFMSSKAITDGSKAIRGGIPLCFPVFGPWSNSRPQHGFARVSSFVVVDQSVDEELGDVVIKLRLEENELSLKLWPEVFFTLDFIVSLKEKELLMEVVVANKKETKDNIDVMMALHTYYKVPDVTQCRVVGLKDTHYLDKGDGGQRKKDEMEEVCINDFVDRVYLDAPNTLLIRGLEKGRSISFVKENFDDVDIWNPWKENSAKMADMGDEDYFNMICVEAVQFGKAVNIQPGKQWRAKHSLTVL